MSVIESKTYYDLLGLTPEATEAEIKQAYREIARVYHPDSNFYDEILDETLNNQALEIFKDITAAYNVLIDSEKRSLYDSILPKGLKDWDHVASAPDVQALPAKEIDNDYMKRGARQRKPTGKHVVKQFGVFREPEAGPDDLEAPQVMRVSEVIQLRRRGVLGRFIDRVLKGR